jgi:glucose-6-phosphate 1-epimerase
LNGLDYVDKVGQKNSKQEGDVVIKGEVDSVYAGVKSSTLDIQFGNEEGGIQVLRKGLSDIVVWNPWVEKAAGMADFGDDEYQRMICVEAGQVADFITLAAEGHWEGSQVLSLL